jgi:hypothetical protein
MNLRTRLRVTACIVGLLICGSLVLGLSILGLTWSRDQSESVIVLFVLTISMAIYGLGWYIIALTVWFGYRYLAEEMRAQREESAHQLDTLTMKHKGKP